MSLSEEQHELASTVRSVLAKRADSAAVRAAVASPLGYDPELWHMLSEQVGVAALPIPEEYDGFGASVVESCLALEEIGASLAPTPMLANLITGQLLLAAGATDLLPRIAAGEVATAAFDGDPTLDADIATILVAALDDRLVLVEQADATRVPTMDQTLRLARVDLAGATTTELACNASAAVEHARAVARVGVAALQAGAARRGLDMTVAYSKERVQFGRPIGSFQALKHRMADMLVLVEMSRSAYLDAATALAEGAPDAAEKAAIAKAYCGDALTRVAGETVQLHGGIGVTWEHDAQLLLKRAHALNQLFGAPHQQRATITL